MFLGPISYNMYNIQFSLCIQIDNTKIYIDNVLHISVLTQLLPQLVMVCTANLYWLGISLIVSGNQ